MNLPKFSKGLELVSAQLNKLSDAIRRSTITSVIGGTLTVTPGGTTLMVDAQTRGGGTGGSVCKWRVQDISEPKEGGGFILKIRVYVDALEPSKRYPTGTTEEVPYKDIELGENREPGWTGVYLRVEVDQQNVPIEGDQGILIQEQSNWAQSSSVIQVTYIAGVTISVDKDNHPYISFVDNYCPFPEIKTPPSCPFLVEDYGLGLTATPKISIRSGTIERHYPTGMNATNTYVLEIPDTQNWFAVYCVMVTDQDGNILTGDNDVTFSLETEYKDSTQTVTFFLIGEVNTGYDADENRVIDYIFNSCQIPYIRGAVASDGTIIPRGTSVACNFRVFDASTEETIRVGINPQTVNVNTGARYPEGMSAGGPPLYFTISATSYIYCKLDYYQNDVIVKTDENAITIAAETTLKINEVNTEYVLLAVVPFTNGKIGAIQNNCAAVTYNPCNLAWG